MNTRMIGKIVRSSGHSSSPDSFDAHKAAAVSQEREIQEALAAVPDESVVDIRPDPLQNVPPDIIDSVPIPEDNADLVSHSEDLSSESQAEIVTEVVPDIKRMSVEQPFRSVQPIPNDTLPTVPVATVEPPSVVIVPVVTLSKKQQEYVDSWSSKDSASKKRVAQRQKDPAILQALVSLETDPSILAVLHESLAKVKHD